MATVEGGGVRTLIGAVILTGQDVAHPDVGKTPTRNKNRLTWEICPHTVYVTPVVALNLVLTVQGYSTRLPTTVCYSTNGAPDMSYVDPSVLRAYSPVISGGARAPFSHRVELLERVDADADAGQDIDLRQLRHHTKNTLQRILGLIAEAPGLCDTPEGEKIVQELEHRIALSANISNALFGLTSAPGSMAERLRQLAGSVVDMMRDADQLIRVGVAVRGVCPPALREAVLRSLHELLGNAVKHGMKGRSTGRITVRLVSDCDATVLSVVDNGWGFQGNPRSGEGLSLACSFADRHGGSLRLEGVDGTVARLELPH
jgi:two-component sensor histidine kinase